MIGPLLEGTKQKNYAAEYGGQIISDRETFAGEKSNRIGAWLNNF